MSTALTLVSHHLCPYVQRAAIALTEKGVAFERYPEIGEFRDNIHHADGMKLVWFSDPDGNILHVNQMPDSG